MRWSTAIGAVIGVGAIAVAVVAVLRPDALLAVLPPGAASYAERDVVLPAVAAFVGLYVLALAFASRRVRSTEHDPPSAADVDSDAGAPPPSADRQPRSAPPTIFALLREEPPESPVDNTALVGEGFEATVASAVANPDVAVGPVRETLRATAIDVEATVAGVDRRHAVGVVDAGAWTDDRVAAAFIADGDVTVPLRRRLYAWLDPETVTRQRIDRTVAAIETRLGETGVGP